MILYTAAMLKKQMKKQMILEELLAAGVTHHQGKPIMECTYDEIKSEMVLLTFRRIDSENESRKWF